MAIRFFSSLLLIVALASTSSAQFFGFGPTGSFGPGGYLEPGGALEPSGALGPGGVIIPGYPPDRVSIRSPFFQLELSPYGGRYNSPYSSFSARGPGLVPPPLPYPGISPRGWRSPRFNDEPRGNVIVPNSRPDLNPASPYPPRYAEPSREIGRQGEFDPNGGFPLPGQSVLEPAPVPPPQYDIPSFSEVFPDNSGDDGLSPATRIANRLQRGTDRLTSNLQRREAGKLWNEYLRLQDVEEFAAQLFQSRDGLADQAQLATRARELAVNFDAVVASPELDWLQASPGFEDIRSTLNAILNAAISDSTTASPNQNQYEDLPPPPAKPINKPIPVKPKHVFRAEI